MPNSKSDVFTARQEARRYSKMFLRPNTPEVRRALYTLGYLDKSHKKPSTEPRTICELKSRLAAHGGGDE